MRILLDHCVPKPFGREFIGHEVRTVFQMGWSALSNGKLLAEAAAAHFDVFLTVDQNIRYQQNLTSLPLPVIALVCKENDPETLRPFAPYVLRLLSNLGGNALYLVNGDGRTEQL